MTIKCVLSYKMGYNNDDFKLKITDKERQVFSTKDDDGIWGDHFGDYIFEDTKRPAFITLDMVEKVMEGNEIEVETPDEYWTSMGYLIQKVKKFNGKPEVVFIAMDETLLDGVTSVFCPYCGASRRVEPDANYKVKCEECGDPYIIKSMI
jgi:hypothetical protein